MAAAAPLALEEAEFEAEFEAAEFAEYAAETSRQSGGHHTQSDYCH